MVSLVPIQNPVQVETATLIWTTYHLPGFVKSPVFSPPNSDNRFRLALAQNNKEIIAFLFYFGPKEEARFYYCYAILDVNDVRHHIREFFWDYNKSLGKDHHITFFISRDKYEPLLVNGSLKVYCELHIFDAKSARPSQLDSFGQLSANYETLLESGKFSDFVVAIGDKQFRVHKAILSARSRVFAAMFEHEDTKEVKEARVVIEDVEVDVFELLIRYIYTGKVDKLDENAAELFVAADKYQLDILKSICEESFSSTLTTETVSGALLLADMHNAEKLKSKCIEYIVKHSKDVMLTEGWKELVKTSRADLVVELFEKLAIKDE